jgi:hypothetical protein
LNEFKETYAVDTTVEESNSHEEYAEIDDEQRVEEAVCYDESHIRQELGDTLWLVVYAAPVLSETTQVGV